MGLMNKLVVVFPTRPLKVMKLKQESSLHQIRRICVAIIFFVLAMFIALRYYPGLIDDYKISHNPVVVDYHTEVKCHVRAIVENCSMKIITNTGQVIKRDFLGGIKRNNQVVTVASADDPSLVTIDLAIDNMLSQFVITTVFTFLFILLVWMSLVVILRTHKMMKVINEISGQRLTPAIVPIKLTSYGKTITALYQAKNAQGADVKCIATFNKNSSGGPIIIGDMTKNKCNVLAVIGQNNPIPILLDENFTRCDFTDSEIQALIEVLC
ncbi:MULTISPECIES: hypothetical protein [unclassified Gilliamella]|uniref:hypothetical protein n=1 Tax=unclassified Gilliamella TaxID=2685620 RepID=UPI00130A7ABA|nr:MULTISPECIES: hypothetical protein [unclassified Gilliamella]MWP49362.1 hypothetical protein [Gilliamella sp. Lep-s35]MWP68986.1 hypothetical protein [Gilliamella sp. Lep-s5]MWP77353.1 hypothetical protein [Gilliamella sp. Lep-s21]